MLPSGSKVLTNRKHAVHPSLLKVFHCNFGLCSVFVFSYISLKKFIFSTLHLFLYLSLQADSFDHLFQPPEGLPAWPLLLPTENISKVVIVEKIDLSALTTANPDTATALAITIPSGFNSEFDQTQSIDSEALLGGASSLALDMDALTTSNLMIDELQLVDPPDQLLGTNDNTAQSSVTYATVLLTNPKQEQQPIHLPYKDGSGSSSSDEGNFSANNSDISGSFPGGLWELDSCRGGEMDDPRRSCSYNSVEELSETSEQEDEEEEEVRDSKHLYYLGMDYPAEDEESEGEEEQSEEETKAELLNSVVLNRDAHSMESHPLLGPADSSDNSELGSASTHGFFPLYMPQFRTAPCTRQLTD